MQPIIGRSVGRAEGSFAFFATVTPTFSLRREVEGVANDVAFTGLSDQRTIGVGTGTRYVLALLHTCLMTEKPEGIQAESLIAGLQKTINNTSLRKHPFSWFDARKPIGGTLPVIVRDRPP